MVTLRRKGRPKLTDVAGGCNRHFYHRPVNRSAITERSCHREIGRLTAEVILAVVVLSLTGCDNPNGPDGAQTQARIETNEAWRFSSGGRDRSGGFGTFTFDIGAGEQCGTARLQIASPGPQPPFLTLTVGRNSQTVNTTDRTITVCGDGPVR